MSTKKFVDPTWLAVDNFIFQSIVKETKSLSSVRERPNSKIPQIDVAPCEGKFLSMIARGSKKILEV